jgi:ankyrin repeat protein
MNHDTDQRLIEAVKAGDEVAVGQALAGGADPDCTVARFRGSVLVEAARSGRLEIVRLLLNAGARVGPTDGYVASPLRVATLEAHFDVVRTLVAHGAFAAEPAARSSVLTEAVSYTAFRPRPAAVETLRVLLEAGAVPGPTEEAPLITAVMRPAAPVVLRLLLGYGADPDQRRSDATPAIVVAARRGDNAAVDVLLQAGADMDACDAQGRTALMHAVERNEQRVVAALLLAGASIDIVSADGMTALQLARGWQRQNIEFMLGERHVSLDDVPIIRTVVRVAPTGIRLAGDPQMLHLLASVIDIALDDLGDDEWQVRTGTAAETARAFAARLRDDIVPAANASWYQLDATADELATARSALVELAYSTTRAMPAGASRLQIIDLLEEFNWQLGR